jgi:peptidoglycan-associated lipoprotein
MNHQRRVVVFGLSIAIAATTAAACSKAPPPPPPAPVDTVKAPNPDSMRLAREKQMHDDSIARDEANRRNRQRQIDDSIAAARSAAEAAARDADAMRATIAAPVHYDFDKADLREDTKGILDQKIPILTTNTGVTIRIAGHTDDRGSGEYNLQLGQRRAAAARDYLVARGVNTARIELVSYGEERPLCQEKNEACWSQNRRAEFEITAGGNMMKKP